MIGKFKKAMITLTMGATLAGVMATPAEAQRHNRYRGHDRGVSTGTAIGIGLLALGVGLAASQSSSRGGYGGGGYYYYEPPRRYVQPRRYYRNCWQERFWDNYYRTWVVRNVCR